MTFLTLRPYDQFTAVCVFVLTALFVVDIIVNFFLAYHVKGKRKLETSLGKIRMRYLRRMFWVDLLAALPWDIIVMAGLGINAEDDVGTPGTPMLPSYIAILKWLTLLRMYRAVELFVRCGLLHIGINRLHCLYLHIPLRHLEYNLYIDQLFVTLIRNQVVSDDLGLEAVSNNTSDSFTESAFCPDSMCCYSYTGAPAGGEHKEVEE